VFLLCCTVLLSASPPDAAEPRFTAQNELLRPEGYREWIFLSSSLGMTYDEGKGASQHPNFHNIFINPAAYRAFRESGRFPENTILMLEIMSSASGSSINRQGHTQGEFRSLEAAVKNSARFPEGWAYFSFRGPDGKLKGQAAAFPKKDCWSCHNEHGQIDNVFTQFYPTLRRQP
jgi:hypothetical protein